MAHKIPQLPPGYLPGTLSGLVIGALVAINPIAAAAFSLLLMASVAMTAPTAAWVAATMLIAVLGRAFTPFGVPEQLALAALPFAWMTLALGVYRYRGSLMAEKLLVGLLALIIVALVSSLVHGDTPLRALFYLALLVTPFALLGAVVFDPPDELWRRRLERLLIGLILIQIPFAFWQTSQFGIGDLVQGTFSGSNVGAHTTAGVTLLGAVWLALRAPHTWLSTTAAALLLVVPLLAAANQVIFALPLAVLVVAAFGNRKLAIATVLGIGLAAALLLLPGWNSNYARSSFDRAAFALKGSAAQQIAEKATASPVTTIVGQGPAQSVSHAAWLTSEADSPVKAIGIAPSDVPGSFDLRPIDASLSVKRPESSVLGIFGDIGLLGALAYILLFGTVFNQCRKRATATGQTAAIGLAMAFILGYISDWLEQPGFTLVVALLAGLALAEQMADQEPGGAT